MRCVAGREVHHVQLEKHFLYQIDYQHWANDRLFEALAHLNESALSSVDAPYVGSLLQLLARQHSELLWWWAHLRGEPARGGAEPRFRAACGLCARMCAPCSTGWKTSLTNSSIPQVEYRTVIPAAMSRLGRDLLSQLSLQLAFLPQPDGGRGRRQLGAPAIGMDFIDYKRDVRNALDHLAGAHGKSLTVC